MSQLEFPLDQLSSVDHRHETKTCAQCNQLKPMDAFRLYKRATGSFNSRDSKCKQCKAHNNRIANCIRETAPASAGVCECCRKQTDKLVLDHCHETETFRGWLCEPCNRGIGVLGDDIKSIEAALYYLRSKRVTPRSST